MKVVVPISKKVVIPKSKKAVDNTKTVPKKSIMDSRVARDGRSNSKQISDVELIEVVDTRSPILDIEDIMTEQMLVTKLTDKNSMEVSQQLSNALTKHV